MHTYAHNCDLGLVDRDGDEMKIVECSACGSTELVEAGDLVVCVYCRSTFVPQADDSPPKETVIALHTDIALLLQKCRDDPRNRVRYAHLVLDLDPTNTEARRYL